jgi:carboxylesterase
VLLLHGFTGTPWELRPLTDALRAQGHGGHAPVLPGHGRTPAALSAMRWEDWVAATDAAARALLATHGRIVLVGMSLGALLALDAAARHREGVVGVVTLGAPLQLAPLARRVLAVASALGPWMPDLYLRKRRGSDVRDPAAPFANHAYPVNPLRAAREVRVGQAAARAALPTLRMPLLALHGMLDRTASLAGSLELVRLAGSAEAALVVLPRSGHLIAVDFDRAQVARQVCAFVRRVARGREEHS